MTSQSQIQYHIPLCHPATLYQVPNFTLSRAYSVNNKHSLQQPSCLLLEQQALHLPFWLVWDSETDSWRRCLLQCVMHPPRCQIFEWSVSQSDNTVHNHNKSLNNNKQYNDQFMNQQINRSTDRFKTHYTATVMLLCSPVLAKSLHTSYWIESKISCFPSDDQSRAALPQRDRQWTA